MKTFMLATCLVMFWIFYEMSGGSDFQPAVREVAEAQTPAPPQTVPDLPDVAVTQEAEQSPEPVAQVAAADVVTEPTPVAAPVDIVVPEPVDTIVPEPVDIVAPEPVISAPAIAESQPTPSQGDPVRTQIEEVTLYNTIIVEDASPTIIEGARQSRDTGFADIRQVAGDRVNMRDGPGTIYSVLEVVDQGTRAEIIEVNLDGWAQIRLLESGKIGWMAERLLTDG